MALSIPDSRSDSRRIDPALWRMAIVVSMAPLMTTLDSTVVNLALSNLAHELHSGLGTIQWVTSGYLLALALVLPLNGWLVDRLGPKRVYLGAFSAFTLASLACGLAPDARGLIVARVAQGFAGGLLAPMAQLMMAQRAGRHLTRLVGVMAVPVLLGPLVGPSLAGLILSHASWRWLFFINVPIGVLALVLAQRLLPPDPEQKSRRRLDLVGYLLLAPGLVLLLHSLEGLTGDSPTAARSGLECACAAALLASFLFWTRRKGPNALLNLGLLKRRSFGFAAATQFLSNAVAMGGQFLLPLYLLEVRRCGVREAALLLGFQGLGMMISFPSMGAAIEWMGIRRTSAGGALLALLATLPFLLVRPEALPWAAVAFALFVRGLGQGAIGTPSIAAAYSVVAPQETANASTTLNILQRLGGPLATATLGLLLHRLLGSGDLWMPYIDVLRVYALLQGVAALTALGLPAALESPALPAEEPTEALNAD
jgi:EmrB/QacA subfamily drug resistance transporter